MKKKIIYITVSLITLAAIIAALKFNKTKTEDRVFRYDREKPVYIGAQEVKLSAVESERVYSGVFEPEKETKIGAEIQGKITELWVDAGSYVAAGQKLMQIDNTLLKIQLENAAAQAEGLEADVKRYSVLAKADAIQGVQLEKALIGLRSAKAQKALIEEQINKTTIKAPFSGIVTAKMTEVGAFAAPGMPLLQITNISMLRFTVNASENDIQVFQNSPSAIITPDALPDVQIQGKLFMVGSKANPGNSFTILFRANNTSDNKIKAGMFGRVHIKDRKTKEGIVVPASAVAGTTNQPQLYKVLNGKAALINVSIGSRFDEKVEISSGLKAGDIIVTDGFINLFDGANVRYK